MDTPVDTIRAWTIGMVLCTIVAAVNILMGLRKSPVNITASVVQLISYPYVCRFSPLVWTPFLLQQRELTLDAALVGPGQLTCLTRNTTSWALSST